MSSPEFTKIDIPAPHVHSSDTPYQFQRDEKEVVTADAFKKTAKFTKTAGMLTFHPGASFLIQGIRMMGGKTKAGDVFGPILGAGMILLSPVSLALKVGIGIPATVIGAIATGATGAVAGGEYAVNKATEHSDTRMHKEELAKRFVTKMHEILKNMPDEEMRDYFKEHITQLASITSIAVAFNSRDEADEKKLKITGGTLSYDQISDQDDKRKKYFEELCEIKKEIRAMHNMPADNDLAWEYLMTSFEKLEKDSNNMDMYEKNEIESLRNINHHAYMLGLTVLYEPAVKEAWEASLK